MICMLHTLCHTLLFESPNLLPHLPLPGGPYYLLAPWVPLSWAPSVVLAALTAGRSRHPFSLDGPLLWGSNVSRFWQFCAAGHPDRPHPLKYPGTDFVLGQSGGPPACTLQKNVKSRCYNCRGDGHFGCVQPSLLMLSLVNSHKEHCLSTATWVSFMVLLHVVLQSLWVKKFLGTEWTLVTMRLSVYPKPCYSF